MIDLSAHIKYLLCTHDCVVLPGVGAFVARHESACAAKDGDTMAPPCRRVAFNSAITADDGLLAWSVSRREGISYREAAAEVSAAIESMISMLEMRGNVDIDRVGAVMRQQSGALEFVPVGANGVVNASFASLPTLQLSAVSNTATVESNILEVDFTAKSSRHSGRFVRIARYAASVAVLIGMGIAFTTPVTVDRNNTLPSQASLALPAVSGARAVKVPVVATQAEPRAVASAQSDTTWVEAVSDVAQSASTVADKGVSLVKDMDANADYSVYVIVASCTSRRGAQRYIRNHGGDNNLRILKSDGRYRVYIAAGNDYDAAYSFKSTDSAIAAAHPDAWVYRKQ